MSSSPIVRDVMSSNLITVGPNATMAKVRQIFQEHTVHHLPVVDENGELVGIISTSDLETSGYRKLEYSHESGEDSNQEREHRIAVSEVMSRSYKTISPDSDLCDAYNEFLQGELRCLPVLEEGVLIGIITPLDLASYPSQS